MVNLTEVINHRHGNNKKFFPSMKYWLLLISVSSILHILVLGILGIFDQEVQKPTKREAIAVDIISLNSNSKDLGIINKQTANQTTDISIKVPRKPSYNQPNNYNISQQNHQNNIVIQNNSISNDSARKIQQFTEMSPETTPKKSGNSKNMGEHKNSVAPSNTLATVKISPKVPQVTQITKSVVHIPTKNGISNNSNLDKSPPKLTNNLPEKILANNNQSGDVNKSLPGNSGDKQLNTIQDGKGVMLTVQNFRLGNGERDIPDQAAQPKLASGKFPNTVYLSGVKSSLGQVIVLRLLVTSQGKVDLNNVQILSGPNNWDYQQLAKNLIKDWEFEPAKAKGQPVDSLLDMAIAIEAL